MLQAPISATEFLKKVVKENKARISKRHNWRLRRVVKASFDYALTISVLILLFPLILIIVVLIKLESEGLVFYHQCALGLNGCEFDAYRFHTMYSNAKNLLIRNREQWVELLRNGRRQIDVLTSVQPGLISLIAL